MQQVAARLGAVLVAVVSLAAMRTETQDVGLHLQRFVASIDGVQAERLRRFGEQRAVVGEALVVSPVGDRRRGHAAASGPQP